MKSVYSTKENVERVFICEDCQVVFTDEEIRRDIDSRKWGHLCKEKKYKKEHRCESFLRAFMPEE